MRTFLGIIYNYIKSFDFSEFSFHLRHLKYHKLTHHNNLTPPISFTEFILEISYIVLLSLTTFVRVKLQVTCCIGRVIFISIHLVAFGVHAQRLQIPCLKTSFEIVSTIPFWCLDLNIHFYPKCIFKFNLFVP